MRIAKLTDYGLVLLTTMAGNPKVRRSARDLAEETTIPLATVSKLLKVFTNARILESRRGVNGGYSLSASPADISVATAIAAVEGPITIVECGRGEEAQKCATPNCLVASNWQLINSAIDQALGSISLLDMTQPLAREKLGL